MKGNLVKTCEWCGGIFNTSDFAKTNSPFYKDGTIPVCSSCIKKYLKARDFEWKTIDRLCQYMNIPFVPKVFEDLKQKNGEDVFPVYVEYCLHNHYENDIGWGEYFEEFKKLKEEGALENQLPGIGEVKLKKLMDKWGRNYTEEELDYLEKLHSGLLATQNVTGALQDDQGLKLCKMSLEIDNRIRDGADFDKLLSSYDKLVKIADFTPKNAKSATDLESVGELYKFLERSGWKNKFYDNVTRDIVDETIKNIQAFNQRLYIDEGGIGDEISRRIEALKHATDDEKYYNVGEEKFDTDQFDNEGYEQLIASENEEFIAEEGENGEK